MPELIPATRPPVVTILGHVDHGKTSLLDRIRHEQVAAGEIGGITQAIGAYQIVHHGHPITFIDTPGHAAFSAMRRRGGQAADIAVLIVAADDSVMPQTVESIGHIKSAGIPFVVAVNKTDLSGINPDKVKVDLANNGVYVEGYGGNIPIVNISAKSGAGIDELLEIILLLAELEDLKNNSDVTPATALVIESSLHPQVGPLATLLVKSGTFKKNDSLFSQKHQIGKVRSMINYQGKNIDSATPSTPFQVIGLSTVPGVGDLVGNQPGEDINLPLIDTNTLSGQPMEDKPSIILKTDVQGSLEAILGAIGEKVNIIHASVGNITEHDVQSAISANAEILGFNVRISSSVAKLAQVEKIKFTNFRIIYQLFDYLDDLVTQKITSIGPKVIETGQATVLKIFNFGGTIVYGCTATSGKIKVGDRINNSAITSLKIGKSDVIEVKKDQEFGLILTPNIDLKPGDIMTATTEASSTDI